MANGDDRVTVWWIDDDHMNEAEAMDRVRAALEENAGPDLNLVAIHPADFEDYASTISNAWAPDLLLIDFRLNTQRHPEKATPFFARDGVTLRGATLGDKILKDVPAYLVSRVTTEEQSGSSDDHFDWVLQHHALLGEDAGRFLLADAGDYRLLRQRVVAASGANSAKEIQSSLVEAICDLLRVPDSSLESVEELSRHTIRTLLRSESHLDSDEIRLAPSRPRSIARWVRSAVQGLRGPLIDGLSAANMLGTTARHFELSIEPALKDSQVIHAGLFGRTAAMTFWKDALLEWLLEQNRTIELSSPARLAQSAAAYFEVPETEKATCRVCKKHWPEAIAFDEDDAKVQAAVHWRCSREAPDVDALFGFDNPRSFA